LFDLEADPRESRSVAEAPEYRRQRDAFHVELTRHFADLGAPPIEEWRSTTKQKLPEESRLLGPALRK